MLGKSINTSLSFYRNDLSFNKTQHLFNPWNEGKPVKIGRDGQVIQKRNKIMNIICNMIIIQEIEPHVASELCRLFPMDAGLNWNQILKNSKEAARRDSHVKVTSPIGTPGGMGMGGFKGRGGMRGDRRDMRGRPNPAFRNTRPFDFGRYNSGLLFRMGSSVIVYKLCEHPLSPLIIS
jgi:hypothetical protein